MNRCIVCGSILKDRILELKNMPKAAQHLPSERKLASGGIDLSLYECPACGLVQFDAPPVAYYKDVIRATKVSPKFRALRKLQYSKLVKMFQLEGKKILEIGCGAGEFLEIWNDFPVKAYGIEHAKELVHAARANGLQVLEGFIENEGDSIIEGPFDAFVSFNFLEHQPNPAGMLRGIAANLKENGVGLITVPSFDYFQERASYYEFMRDHIAYYSEDSLNRILNICGFDVIEMNRFNEDTLEAIVRKRSPIKLVDYYSQRDCLEKEMNGYLEDIVGMEGMTVVWGASHQAFTILSTIEIKEKIQAVIDSASFKWNKYTPVTQIPITSPEILKTQKIKCVIIMAPGFSDEIYHTILVQAPSVQRILTVIDGHVTLLK